MKSATLNDQEEAKKDNSSKNESGTDPNRYADYHTVEEAEKISENKSDVTSDRFRPKLKVNVSTVERILMIGIGSYFLYKALTEDKKKTTESLLGIGIIARGVTGYCPAYDAIGKTFAKHNSN